MNKERLLKLADKLDTVPAEKFDMRNYVSEDWNDETGCGSCACALGWAITIPEFELKHVPGDIYFNGLYGSRAAEAFFDIAHHEALQLFYPSCGSDEESISPTEMAEKLRRFVETGIVVQMVKTPDATGEEA